MIEVNCDLEFLRILTGGFKEMIDASCDSPIGPKDFQSQWHCVKDDVDMLSPKQPTLNFPPFPNNPLFSS